MTPGTSLQDELLTYIVDDFVDVELDAELDRDSDLLTSGIVDSLGVMRLVRLVEERSGIRIPPEDITIQHFLTVGRICDYVVQRTADSGLAEHSTAS